MSTLQAFVDDARIGDAAAAVHALGRRFAGAVRCGAAYVRQSACGLRGHDLLLQFDARRMSLRCASCGWRSAGWEIGAPPPAGRGRGPSDERV